MTIYSDRLTESGLTAKDAKLLGLKLLRPKDTAKCQPHYREVEAIFIPYFDAQGKKLDFHRVRYLAPISAFEQGRKYDGPQGHPPRAYFPKLLRWAKIIADPRIPITVTEGEFKAACAAKKGLVCIGLGGVWNWRSKQLGVEFLPELEAFTWKDRRVELCFDSDIVVKPEVRQALVALGRALSERGAQVVMVLLPQEGDAKVGLDDFLVAQGLEAYQALERQSILQSDAKRQDFLQRFLYLRTLDQIVDLEDRALFRTRQHFLNATGAMRYLTAEGRERPLALDWYQSPQRMELPGFVFEPGSPQRLIPGRGINLYEGLAVEPRQGSVAPMLRVVDALVGKRPEIRQWLLQWMAAPLQRPGTKLHTCVFVFSRHQGIGKTALGQILLDIYGRHGQPLSEDDFFGTWNDWLEQKLFALCDELSFDGSKKSRSIFKRLVTGENAILSGKYRERHDVRNRCNFYFTGNNPGGLPLEQGMNRRVLVLEAAATDDPEWRSYLRTEFHHWRHEEQGPARWLHYLLHRVDLTGFTPYGDAPTTEEERLAIDSSGTALEAWLAEAIHHPPFDRSDLWLARHLLETYKAQTSDHRTSTMAMNRALAALPDAKRLRPIPCEGVLEVSLWALRHAEKWKSAKPKAISAEWERGRFRAAPGA